MSNAYLKSTNKQCTVFMKFFPYFSNTEYMLSNSRLVFSKTTLIVPNEFIHVQSETIEQFSLCTLIFVCSSPPLFLQSQYEVV